MNWHDYFPAGAKVIALPCWQSPRLYLPAENMRVRWHGSGFYPAFKPLARLRRLLLRLRAMVGLGAKVERLASGWPVGEFVGEALPEVHSVVVLEGTPGPAQRVTVQLRDGNSRVLGYLTYAEKGHARRRLLQERGMLNAIPPHSGPAVLKYGPLDNGEGLLVEALPGRLPPVRLEIPPGAIALVRSWVGHRECQLVDHPWVRNLASRGGAPPIDLLEPLSHRSWPVAIQHGDFAPWNLLLQADGSVKAIDWEYGTLEGLPYLDLAYYTLQVAALVYRWSPRKAREYAAARLLQCRLDPLSPLSAAEASSIVRLAAYDAHCRTAEDGHLPCTPQQRWRRQVWAE